MDEHAPQLKKDADAGSFRHVPARYLWPNLLTLLALCSGITAIRLGIEQRYELAVGAVMFAIVLDALDGRLARLIKGTSRFGAELDSLADFVNFGVAPAILIYLWALNSMRPLGWIVALMHAICCALRLARFNVALDDGTQPAWKSAFFTGVPAPAGAALAMAPMYLGFLGLIGDGHRLVYVIGPYVALVAILMVSRIPTYSGKTMGASIRRDLMLPILGVCALVFVLLFSYPWHVLIICTVLYFALIPFAIRSYRRRLREDAGAESPRDFT
ncbi:MAG: CDP-alcohol phosphatidyltransferase family protein [Aestuariivirga sp.]